MAWLRKLPLIKQLSRLVSEEIKIKSDGDSSFGYQRDPRKRTDIAAKKAEAVSALQRRSSEEDEDPFLRYYTAYSLIQPPYPFLDLWRIYEECDTLQACIQSRIDNIERPHDFEFAGDDKSEKTLPANVQVRISLRDFFSRVNEKESFLDLRKKRRREEDVTKNAFVEVIRNITGTPERLYYQPSTNMRITRLDELETPATYSVPRDGKILQVTWGRRFRRFAYLYHGGSALTWFKEFGDPRVVDYRTGEYVKNKDGSFMMEPADYPDKATEIWWFTDRWGGNAYGVPDWISALMDIKGRYESKWVNFSHLSQGAIPPFAFAPQGGRLTKNSKQELDQIIAEMQDSSFYNRPIILEMEPDMAVDLNKGATKSQTSLNVIKLRDPNHEDFMFGKYLAETSDSIRKVFRLPPIFIGSSTDYTNATSYASIEVAESQVFEPARRQFDAKVTTELIQNEFHVYQWNLKTRSSTLGDKETLYRALGTIIRNGAGSSNQVIEMANNLLGTDWSQYEGDVYQEPVSIVQSLVAAGMVAPRNGKLEFVETPVGGAAPNPNQGTEPVVPPELQGAVKSEDDNDVREKALALFEILDQIEKGTYSPPTEAEIANAV